MGKIILEEQVEVSTPASNKVAVYPKAGGGIYKKADDGVESLLATKAYVDTSISGVDEHSEMLGLTAGDDHTQYIRVDGTRAFTGDVSINDGNELRFYDDDNSHYVALKAPAVSSTITWVLPDTGGTGLTPIDDGLGALVMGGHNDLNGYLVTEHFTEASIDHGSIAGLGDNDHAQYLTTTNFTVYSGTLQTDINTKLKIDGTDAFTGNVQANASGTLDIGAVATPFNDIFAETINLQLGNAPATATSAGTIGTIAWDANYIYVCVNTNVWNRTAISGSW